MIPILQEFEVINFLCCDLYLFESYLTVAHRLIAYFTLLKFCSHSWPEDID